MSERRRAARAVAAEPVALTDVVTALRDPQAALWHDRDAYIAFMDERGWSLPAQERMGASSSPGNRRSAAAEGWAMENGVTFSNHADWHQLRAMGLVGELPRFKSVGLPPHPGAAT